MSDSPSHLTDYITGKKIPNIGAELNRQRTEKKLVEEKGYRKDEILVDVPVKFQIDDEPYNSFIDIVVSINGRPVIAIKVAAGSLGSREREILAAARIVEEHPIPLCMVTDGKFVTVLKSDSGKKVGDGWDAVPSSNKAKTITKNAHLEKLTSDRLSREQLIFRTYDSMNVNRRDSF